MKNLDDYKIKVTQSGDDVDEINKALDRGWASYYAQRAVDLEVYMNTRYGLKLRKTYNDYFEEFLQGIKKNDLLRD